MGHSRAVASGPYIRGSGDTAKLICFDAPAFVSREWQLIEQRRWFHPGARNDRAGRNSFAGRQDCFVASSGTKAGLEANVHLEFLHLPFCVPYEFRVTLSKFGQNARADFEQDDAEFL